jgi:OOP family OmpA-OmpF porin
MLKTCEYREKFDNFLVIMDASTSMGEKLGPLFSNEPSKLVLERDLISCLNSSLPDDFGVNAGLRIFGPGSSEKNNLIYGMTKYSKADMGNAAMSVNSTAGVTPLSKAITFASTDLKDMKGDTAVIIFSDGLNNVGDPVAAAAAMKEMYGNDVCIYTVLIGDDPKGKMTLEQVAEAGKCGFATEANNLHSRTLSEGCEEISFVDGMGDFVTKVFVESVPDSDGDGVTDKCDKCLNTPKGTKVDSDGCPVAMAIPAKVNITLLVEFDFDKTVVKPQYHGDLEKVANFLKEYPKTTAELEGHTDSVGTDGYNMKLSERRAASVKKYLVEKFNIDAARITTVGYGESKPVASNDTAEGRQMNRRVVANVVTLTVK